MIEVMQRKQTKQQLEDKRSGEQKKMQDKENVPK